MSNTNQQYDQVINSCREIYLKKAKDYGIAGGVVVKKINNGVIDNQTRMRDGFIIVKVNDTEVKDMDGFIKALGNSKTVTISGFYPGNDGLYDYPITLED